MPVKRIRQIGDEVLWRKSSPVADPGAPPVAALAEDLRDTLLAFRREHGYGRGIAAPQIGVSERVIVVDAPESGFAAVLVNPEIVQHSDVELRVEDFCFSIPGLVVEVSRFAEIAVEFLDLHCVKRTVEATGGLAELLQHEIDHLNGILMLDRAATPHSIYSREEWERQQQSAHPGAAAGRKQSRGQP
jgi:peptide deformylase